MRFHVRDSESAEGDLQLMMKRYRLERAFVRSAGEPMGCLMFTCIGRGKGLYQRQHVDCRAVVEVLQNSQEGAGEGPAQIAGFFANGEIGSPGLAMPDPKETLRSTSLHGFTAVFAMLVPVQK